MQAKLRTFVHIGAVLALAGVCAVDTYKTHQDRKAWADYAKAHACQPHTFRPTVRVFDSSPNGKGGMVYVDGIMWKCADGSEHWRPIDKETAHMIPVTQPLSPRARDWYSIPALKLP